ncbi:hypothetical protein B0H13DRAFT_2542770 [Mycena leptocephala]|nr:hypothetical protein B0H13DRAFT_2542770 [Mycena leptocephala]
MNAEVVSVSAPDGMLRSWDGFRKTRIRCDDVPRWASGPSSPKRPKDVNNVHYSQTYWPNTRSPMACAASCHRERRVCGGAPITLSRNKRYEGGPAALEDNRTAAHGEGGCVWAEAPGKWVRSKTVEGGSPLDGGDLPWIAPTKLTLNEDGFPRLRRVDTAYGLLVPGSSANPPAVGSDLEREFPTLGARIKYGEEEMRVEGEEATALLRPAGDTLWYRPHSKRLRSVQPACVAVKTVYALPAWRADEVEVQKLRRTRLQIQDDAAGEYFHACGDGVYGVVGSRWSPLEAGTRTPRQPLAFAFCEPGRHRRMIEQKRCCTQGICMREVVVASMGDGRGIEMLHPGKLWVAKGTAAIKATEAGRRESGEDRALSCWAANCTRAGGRRPSRGESVRLKLPERVRRRVPCRQAAIHRRLMARPTCSEMRDTGVDAHRTGPVELADTRGTIGSHRVPRPASTGAPRLARWRGPRAYAVREARPNTSCMHGVLEARRAGAVELADVHADGDGGCDSECPPRRPCRVLRGGPRGAELIEADGSVIVFERSGAGSEPPEKEGGDARRRRTSPAGLCARFTGVTLRARRGAGVLQLVLVAASTLSTRSLRSLLSLPSTLSFLLGNM